MDKRFWGILIAAVIVLAGIYWLSTSRKASAPGSTSSSQPTNHVEGQGKDSVTLVEYGDYECPYCEAYYPIVKQVAAEYNTEIYFQFRNLPLTQIHPNAFAGARAAEAAGLMGKFWQMHDALYDNQNQWVQSSNPEQYFDQYALQLGLNVTQFNQNFSSDTVNNLINADVTAFSKTKLPEATPTFFLDGSQIQVTATVANFEQFINTEIVKKGFKPPATTSTSGNATSTTGQSVQPSSSSTKK